MNWLDTPLEGRALIEYAIGTIKSDWEVRNGKHIVCHIQGAGPRPPKGHAKRRDAVMNS